MQNMALLMNTSGRLYLEVPNIAYLPKRFTFMLTGKSPLTPIDQIYYSQTPFIGHHHEYTMEELKILARLSNLKY